jgi:hypothetical protein
MKFVEPAFLKRAMVFIARFPQTLDRGFAPGVIKCCVELDQITRTACTQFELVYLPGTQEKNGVVEHLVSGKIYFMFAFPFFEGKNKEKVMPVQVMDQTGFAYYIFYPAYFEPLGGGKFLWRNTELPDWNRFHSSSGWLIVYARSHPECYQDDSYAAGY